jgi:hypothetical protein
MSRSTTLEEYLERFVEEHTRPLDDEVMLAVTDEQLQGLGLFFLEGLGAFIHGLKSEREFAPPGATEVEPCDPLISEVVSDVDGFIN